MDWIVNDLRQTTTASITNNLPLNPSKNIKFQKVIEYSVKAGVPSPDFGNFIEYTYNPDSKTITRTDPGKSPGSWVFNNIANLDQPIFKTRQLDGNIEPLIPGSLIGEGNLVIELIGKKEVKLPLTTVNVAYILQEEVCIRRN
ncbi:MAG: hypothetical protein Q8N80_05835 [Candidatus Omnitrophota bacterium]|nr:hypothetical protein [Candidatus Omnitrophota bacterium]